MRRYGLSIALAALFLLSWAGQAAFQVGVNGEEWGEFWASTLENWQSEFLQLVSFVVLSAFLVHRGSPQSKDGGERLERKVDALLLHHEKDRWGLMEGETLTIYDNEADWLRAKGEK